MAEFIFRDLIKKTRKNDDFFVSSAATSSEELGNPVYPPAKAELARHGLSCAGKYAKQVKMQDYAFYDKLIVMDEHNRKNLLKFFDNGDPDSKITKLLDYTSTPGDIEDPWYSGNYAKVYQQIKQACTVLVDTL